MKRQLLILFLKAVMGVMFVGVPFVGAQSAVRGPVITGNQVDYNLTDLDPTWELNWSNRRGMRSDSVSTIRPNSFASIRMPRLNNNRGDVNNWTREHFLIEAVPFSGQNLRTDLPSRSFMTTNWISNQRRLNIYSVIPKTYHVFRFFDFENKFKDPNGRNIGRDTENLIVVIHGWNRTNESNQFSGAEFSELLNNLTDVVRPRFDWRILAYRWEPDAATGGAVSGESFGIANSTQAAEISHLHGQHLGEMIHANTDNISKVHIIAHSAGTWAARSAAKYLQERAAAQVQITLLDPYIPGRTLTANSVLIQSHVQDRIFVNAAFVENYYSSLAPPGTIGQFSWPYARSSQRSFRSFSHSLPIERYAQTILDPADFDYGWRHSLFIQDTGSLQGPELIRPVAGEQPRRFMFNWRQLDHAQNYEIMVRRMNPAVGDYTFFMRRFVTDPSYLDNLWLQRGVYQWFVRGYNSLGESGSWSSAGNFHIGGLDSPTVLRPRTDIVEANTPERYNRNLEFRTVDGANRYQIQLRLPGGRVISSTVSSSFPGGRSVQVLARNLQRDRNHHWRVRAGITPVRVGDRDSDAEWSNWSSWNRFSVSQPAPNQSFLLSTYSTGNRPPYNLWWRGYQFRVSRDVEVFTLRGGGEGDFAMGLYEADGNIPRRLIAQVPGNMSGRRVSRSVPPVRLRRGQDYILAQGRKSGSGSHYGLHGVRNVNNHPIIGAWYQPSIPLRWQWTGAPESILNMAPNDSNEPALDIGFHYRIVR